MLAKKIPHPVEPSTLKSRHRRDRHVRQVKYDTGWGTEALQSVNPRSGEDARRGPWSTEGGQYLEKIKQKSRRHFSVSARERFPAPQFQRWARHHPRSSPRGQKFGETELALRATPTLKLGGGESATPQFHQRTYRSSPNNSVLFLSPNFVLLPDGPSPSSPKNPDGGAPRGQLRCRQHKSHMRVGHRNHFGSDYNFNV